MNTYTELVCDYTVNLDRISYKNFNISTNSVTDLFDKLLHTKIKNIQKIRIDLFDTPNKFEIYEPQKLSPMVHIFKSFDFAHYFAQTLLERRKIILETLYECITAVCQKMSLDIHPFTAAYLKVKELNYQNRFVYGKMSLSKNRKTKAGIEIEINETEAEIRTVFTDTNEQPIHKITLLKTIPHYLFIYRVIHSGKWLNNTDFEVSDRTKSIHFRTSLDKPQAEISFTPNHKTIEELQHILEEIKPT